MGREVEIYPSPLGSGAHRPAHFVSQPQGPGTPAVVRPWPLATPSLAVSVEARQLHQLQFADDAELAAALRQAPIETLRWELHG